MLERETVWVNYAVASLEGCDRLKRSCGSAYHWGRRCVLLAGWCV